MIRAFWTHKINANRLQYTTARRDTGYNFSLLE